MYSQEPILLKRDCEAIQIPSGTKMEIPKGSEVRITQSLGGSFTVVTDSGYMAKIAGKDADALGLEVPPEAEASSAAGGSVEKLVWDQLKTCYDPEIPVNIVDLGLIYDCKVEGLLENEHRVRVKMTLTAPGCGMGQALTAEAQSKLLTVPGVKEVDVELVWEPQWNQTMMSEAAKLQLGLL